MIESEIPILLNDQYYLSVTQMTQIISVINILSQSGIYFLSQDFLISIRNFLSQLGHNYIRLDILARMPGTIEDAGLGGNCPQFSLAAGVACRALTAYWYMCLRTFFETSR